MENTKKIAKLVYQFLFWLDQKLGNVEEFDYETAPYCGHHYNGHLGKLTESSYHEGDGERWVKLGPLFKISHHNDEGWRWVAPCLSVKMLYNLGDKNTFTTHKTYYTLKGLTQARQVAKKAIEAGLQVKFKYSIV